MNQSRLTTTAVTALRIILGFLFAAHGWQKFIDWTIAGTQASFATMGSNSDMVLIRRSAPSSAWGLWLYP